MNYFIKIKILICEGKGKWEVKKETMFYRSAQTLEEAHNIIQNFKDKYEGRFIGARIYHLEETF